MSQQGNLRQSTLESLTGNTGGAVPVDGAGNINVIGSPPYTTSGNPGTSTLTITDDGTLATTYTTDSGNATPAANVINVLGGTNMNTSGAGSTITINLDSDVLGLTDLTVDNLELNGNTLSSTDVDGSIIISPNGTGGAVIPTDLTVGSTTQDVIFTINGVSIDSLLALHLSNSADIGGLVEERNSNTSGMCSHILNLRSRGTKGAPLIVQDGDHISRFVSCGYDGTDYAQASEIRTEVDGTPGNDDMPGRIKLLTSPDGTQVPVLAMTISEDQSIQMENTLTLALSTENAIPLFGASGLISEIGPLTNGQLIIGSTGAPPSAAALISTDDTISITNGAGSIDLELESNTKTTALEGWNGAIIETPAVTVTSDGATITFSVEKNGGGDLTVVFSDGFFDWDTTPADTITLTAGSDTSPTENFVYFLQSTKTLTVNTSAFPSAEHAPLATVLCQSAASLQTNGAYKVHAWTDHIVSTTDQGHIADLNAWIRNQNATWKSGVNQTYTITTNGGAPDNVILTTASGIVLQLHTHSFPAFSGTPDVYVVNDSVTPYDLVTDLNALLTDSTGASMAGRYFSLVIWGVVSESSADSKLYCNLPSGSYNNQSGVEADLDEFATFTIPAEFKGTGFLISEWKLRQQVASGGTWTSIAEIDLRGLNPATSVGGGTAAGSEFIDNAFRILDDSDNTKEIAFQADQITTSTTRTITMVDADLDLATVANSFPTDSGTAAPTANALSIVGSGGVSTSASGTTITISGAGSIGWTEVTGTSQAMTENNGYIANNAALVTLTLPATSSLGTIIRVDGKGAGGWLIAQNAGQTVHFSSQDTTTGAGGSLASTDQYDCVAYRCITANTDWVVESVIGNLTVV